MMIGSILTLASIFWMWYTGRLESVLGEKIKQSILEEIEKLPDIEVAVRNKHGRIGFKATKDIRKLLGDE